MELKKHRNIQEVSQSLLVNMEAPFKPNRGLHIDFTSTLNIVVEC